MATTPDRATPPDERTEATDDRLVERTSGAAPPRLDLLDDPHTREILVALCRGPRRGRDLTAACAASRSTVYRRLDRLKAAGFVATDHSIDPDGHHCKRYRLQRDRLTVRIDADGLTVTLRPSDGTDA